MKSVCTLLLGLAFAASAVAQDPDKDALRKELLKEVEKRLKNEDERLLKDIEKLIDEELRGGNKTAPKVAPKPEPKQDPKVEPKVEPKTDAPKRKGRGYLGVRLIELSDEDKKDLGVKGGLKIGEVVAGGPAAKAGLQVDDVILTLDGRAIDTTQELAPIMQSSGAGASMKVEYQRDGKKKTSTIVLGAHPSDAPAPQAEPPKEQGKTEEDLRERVKKFLQKKEAPPQDQPKPKAKPAPDEGGGGGLDDFFAVDEEMFEQFREMFEKFGVDPEQFFEKGKDGKYRLNDQMKDMFKNFNFKDFLPKGAPGEEPAPKPKKVEPRKAEPKAETPRIPKPWLGISPEDLPDELRAQLDLPEGEGLLVTEVVSGSPAEKAGLKKNDILTKIDGKAVKGEDSLAKFMASARAGQEATLTVLRKSKEQTIKVTVGEK
jgi:membrane-associated protease RseP (regulator of RpoE activity)